MNQRAIRMRAPGEAAIATVPIPKLRDDYILVKTAAVALNPADWKFIDHIATVGETVGCDYSGVVQQVGPRVANGLSPGDRVAGLVHGCNASYYEDGAFAEYITAKGTLQMKIPDGMVFEDAATLGAGIIAVGQALYQSLALPLPDGETRQDTAVLIYGGSTATGSLAVQVAKLSGLTVITTCSPRHATWLRDLGADHVFDYKSPTCAEDIRRVTKNRLTLVFDTITAADSTRIACDAIGSYGGTYTSLAPVSELPRSDVISKNTVVFTAIGEAFHVAGSEVPVQTEDYKFATKFIKLAQDLLIQGKFKVHPVSHQHGGLDGVLEGLDKMRAGDVSGVKLVYSVGGPEK